MAGFIAMREKRKESRSAQDHVTIAYRMNINLKDTIMITNFEEYTKELTENERDFILPVLVKVLRARTTKERVITNKQIVENLEEKLNLITSEPRVRKMINVIRMTGLVIGLIATGKGYYCTKSEEALKVYIESLEQRISSMESLKEQMHYHLRMLKNGQETSEVKSEQGNLGFVECP